MTTYEETLEFCKFLQDAWMDGYDFKTFNYTPELQSACLKYLQSRAYYALYAHKELETLKISEMVQVIVARMLSTMDDQDILVSDASLASDDAFLKNFFGYNMKFTNFNKIHVHKFFILMGEHWNLKAFLNLVTDDFKWDYVPPSSMALIELFEDEVQNGTVNVTIETVKVKYND